MWNIWSSWSGCNEWTAVCEIAHRYRFDDTFIVRFIYIKKIYNGYWLLNIGNFILAHIFSSWVEILRAAHRTKVCTIWRTFTLYFCIEVIFERFMDVSEIEHLTMMKLQIVFTLWGFGVRNRSADFIRTCVWCKYCMDVYGIYSFDVVNVYVVFIWNCWMYMIPFLNSEYESLEFVFFFCSLRVMW